MKTTLLATLVPCIIATQQLNAQTVGLPFNPSAIISGTISGRVYDVTLKDGTRQTGNISSKIDANGNGSIISWPDGGPVTVTRIRNGSAVIFGPSR